MKICRKTEIILATEVRPFSLFIFTLKSNFIDGNSQRSLWGFCVYWSRSVMKYSAEQIVVISIYADIKMNEFATGLLCKEYVIHKRKY